MASMLLGCIIAPISAYREKRKRQKEVKKEREEEFNQLRLENQKRVDHICGGPGCTHFSHALVPKPPEYSNIVTEEQRRIQCPQCNMHFLEGEEHSHPNGATPAYGDIVQSEEERQDIIRRSICPHCGMEVVEGEHHSHPELANHSTTRPAASGHPNGATPAYGDIVSSEEERRDTIQRSICPLCGMEIAAGEQHSHGEQSTTATEYGQHNERRGA